MRAIWILPVLLAAGFAAGPVPAAVTVIGSGMARDCYLAAELSMSRSDAIEICNRALIEEDLRPRDRAATFVNRGIIRMQAKQYALAIRDYEHAIKAQPRLAEAYVNKGIAMVHLGDRTAAIPVLSQGLALNPTRPEVAYYARGVAHELNGSVREAYDDYVQAQTLKPDWAEPAKQLERFQVMKKDG